MTRGEVVKIKSGEILEQQKVASGEDTKGKRKVIQVSHSSTYDQIGRIRHKTTIALCNDGTIWEYDTEGRGEWRALPSIPE